MSLKEYDTSLYKKELYLDLEYAYNVSGPYSPKVNTGLVRHPREEDDAYIKRQYLGQFPPFLRLLVDHNTVRPIFRDPPTRNFNGNEFLEDWSKNVDSGMPETPLQVKMPRFLRSADLFGCCFIVAENHPEEVVAGKLRSELATAGLLPYFYQVKPRNKIDLILSSRGHIERFVWSDKSTDERGRLIDVARVYTTDRYLSCPLGEYSAGMDLIKIKTKYEDRSNDLGFVPIYAFMGVDEDISSALPESRYNYALQGCKRIYNLTSWIDANCRDTAFPVFYGPEDMSKPRADIKKRADGTVDMIKEAEINIGTQKGLRIPNDAKNPPGFLAPPSEPTTLMQVEREKTIEDMMLHYAISWWGTSAAESGESKRQDKSIRNETLEYLAHQCEALENWMFKMIGIYMGIESDVEIIYNTDFSNDDDLIDFVTTAIEVLGNSLGLAPEVKTRVRKNVISRYFSELPSDTVGELLEAQEEYDEEKKNQTSLISGMGIMNDQSQDQPLEDEDAAQ